MPKTSLPKAKPMKNTIHRYGSIAMLFHWTIAVLILTNFPLGIYFNSIPRGSAQWLAFAELHVSIGISVLVLSLLRLGWRLRNPIPDLPSDSRPGVRKLARFTHYALYTLMILVPLLGWAIVSLPPRPLVLFGVMPWPKIGFLFSLPAAGKLAAGKILGPSHVIGAFLLIALAIGHAAAAIFYHYWIRKDQVLQRMIPGTKIIPDPVSSSRAF